MSALAFATRGVRCYCEIPGGARCRNFCPGIPNSEIYQVELTTTNGATMLVACSKDGNIADVKKEILRNYPHFGSANDYRIYHTSNSVLHNNITLSQLQKFATDTKKFWRNDIVLRFKSAVELEETDPLVHAFWKKLPPSWVIRDTDMDPTFIHPLPFRALAEKDQLVLFQTHLDCPRKLVLGYDRYWKRFFYCGLLSEKHTPETISRLETIEDQDYARIMDIRNNNGKVSELKKWAENLLANEWEEVELEAPGECEGWEVLREEFRVAASESDWVAPEF
ncbi:hypothetical protein BJ508DRAFT_335540 [Ascobolus immersus RN42]|uniref:Uncharacterized protein n=1 Tax=Ascobolus immersus RN42 TaxID=1160509 RepID=A0A3N4HBY9_ASCIM|nr:hypothetical protein BJ508DRAFT_335540 [Ascobolus immersus RN42]